MITSPGLVTASSPVDEPIGLAELVPSPDAFARANHTAASAGAVDDVTAPNAESETQSAMANLGGPLTRLPSPQ
jgi:hypothetical protein